MTEALYKLLVENLPDTTNKSLAVHHGLELTLYGQLAETLGAKNWFRTAGTGEPVMVWPTAETLYGTILLPVPKGRATLELCLAATSNIVAAGGGVYMFGLNDEGIKSADSSADRFYKNVETVAVGAKGRIYRLSQPIRQDYRLDEFKATISLHLHEQNVDFISYPGLFAKGQLDEATALLISNLPVVSSRAHILDYACGIGPIAKALELQKHDIDLTVVDFDPLALLAAQQNLRNAHAICVNDPQQLVGSYDLIVSNPPIHEGQALSYRIVEKLIDRLPYLLKQGGSAYFVTQVTVPVKKLAENKWLAVTEVAASRSFRVNRITV